MIGNSNSRLTFNQYIADCRKHLQEKRILDSNLDPQLILDCNLPFELIPTTPIPGKKHFKYGVLLIHGLFDCPFSVKDIGLHLQEKGMLCRAVLLPGHGTLPDDLLQISYQDWLSTVRFGIDSMRDEVDNIILLGFSTGAALAIHMALSDPDIVGVLMLAPLVQLKSRASKLLESQYITNWFSNHRQWLVKNSEIDYAKYTSISFNSVYQAAKLTRDLVRHRADKKIHCPLFVAISQEDQVISSREAINLFTHYENPKSELLLYAEKMRPYPDKRIEVRKSRYPELNIKNFSHVAMPFSPQNPHYGQQGDFIDASRIDAKNTIYGAYNNIEIQLFQRLYDMGIMKRRRKELTYNPDFAYMSEKIIHFILKLT